MARKGLLLVGHGSKLPFNQELVESTGHLIATRHPEFIVRCAFMNINSPTIEESLKQFKEDEIDAIVVVPLFLAKGVHILHDIPPVIGLTGGATQGSFQKNGSTIPLYYADPIGSDPLLADLMVKNAVAALKGH
ncbi:MAG: sirohydrochlorin nickelochelatase [Methanomicrobiales archaeon]|nr:sirohydrochlorin nickelochelatase [Methanomicrobiales archaeon]